MSFLHEFFGDPLQQAQKAKRTKPPEPAASVSPAPPTSREPTRRDRLERGEYSAALRAIPADTLAKMPPMVSLPSVPRPTGHRRSWPKGLLQLKLCRLVWCSFWLLAMLAISCLLAGVLFGSVESPNLKGWLSYFCVAATFVALMHWAGRWNFIEGPARRWHEREVELWKGFNRD